MKKLVFSILLLISFIFSAQDTFGREFTVGVSPSLINLGEVPPGSSKLVSFFIVTVSDETLLVYLEPAEALIDFFDNPNYKSYIYDYSQEPTAGWIQIFSNPVELKPISEITTLGGTIKGWREVNVLLNIPENAEPGYHLVRVLPKPALPTGAIGQVGVQIAAVTPVVILFRISGDAIRDGKILDITTGRQIGNNLELLVHFLNTGTVSISARANDIKIYGKNSVINLTSEIRTIKPGEKQVLTALLPLDGLEAGEYNVFTNVDFITGNVQKNSTINIYPKLALVPPAVTPKPMEIPLWFLILIAILMIGTIVYRLMHED